MTSQKLTQHLRKNQRLTQFLRENQSLIQFLRKNQSLTQFLRKILKKTLEKVINQARAFSSFRLISLIICRQ